MLALPEINFQRTPVTLIITAVAVAIELASTLKPEMRDAYYNDFRLGLLSHVWAGEVWRPFTTALLHGSLLHAAFNCYWMVTLGSALERRLGSLPMLGLIAMLAYVSMLPQFVVTNYNTPVNSQVGVVGLSGVVYGLFGMLWMGRRFVPEFRYVCNEQTVQIMLFWFVFCVVATRFNIMPVANIAHGAGLLFGVLYGLAVFDRANRRGWLVLAAACTLAVLATLVYCPGHNGYEHHRRYRAASRPTSAPARVAETAPPENLRSRQPPARPRHLFRDRAGPTADS